MSHNDEIGVVTARYALRRMRTANPVANMLAPAIISTSGHGEEGRSPPVTGSVVGAGAGGAHFIQPDLQISGDLCGLLVGDLRGAERRHTLGRGAQSV